ncbi:MAG: substrate-binding domain-containing protein [Alphaproteobacteria bacterium]
MELLTTAEAANYLRLKERKLYELVATGAIPCTKVTGRWLFPRADLDRWLVSGLARPDGLAPVDPPPIIGGSHDPLLEWTLRESGSGLATLAEGSEAGIARFIAGEVAGAAIHLHSVRGDVADANVAAVSDSPRLQDCVLIAFARREQGLVANRGNPLGLASIADVAARRARITQRPAGAGAQLLLLALLGQAGITLDALARVEPACPTGPDVAQAIRAGHADCGIATRAIAEAAGLDFVPLIWERFDLLLRQREYFRPPMQAVVLLMGAASFRRRADELGGYDVTEAGRVRSIP